ncbi:hypothetical protein COCOBI_07-5660 [Coccomyxa sp. Obi]|nr:hypothetical protein COCOBI_07-5660 [Coccomyxa sp. Obi]
MRGRVSSPSYDAESHSSFGHRPSELERAFDLRDPYKLNRAPLLRGGKRRLSGLPSYAAVVLSAVVLVGLGVYIGREIVRPPQRSWEGFDPAKEPRHITEMRSIQTGLRNNQQRPGYSSFACTGHKWEDDYLYHSCRFHDICLNHTSMEFQYYVDPAEAETPLFYHYLNGHPHFTFPSDFIMTGHVHILPYTPWAPKVLHGRIPERHPYSPAPVVVYHSLNDFVGSFRHAMFDFIIPVFNLLQLFRMYTPDFLLLEAQHQGHDPDAARFLIKPDDPARSLTKMISQNKVATPKDVVRAAPPKSDATCFHTILAGSGHLQASEARVRTSPFWAAAIANLGVEVPPAPPRPVVTVVTKKGRRSIENAAEIADALRQRFMGVDVQLLDGNSLNTISVKARVAALGRTTVLVTPCGSLAALAYLLPPGSTAIIMNFYHAETGANVQLDDAAFWNLDHVTLAYYPVGPEDYEGTSDRPGCQKQKGDPQYEEEGALVNCNLRIADVERMEHVVGQAIRRWYAEFGDGGNPYGQR